MQPNDSPLGSEVSLRYKNLLVNPIDFSDYVVVEEAKKELEWALEELYWRLHNHVKDLPDIASLIPWLKSTSKRPLSEDDESTSHDIKKP